MRGIAIRGDVLGSQSICFSCLRRIASEYGVSRASSSQKSSSSPRKFATMTASNPPPKIRKTGIWQLPRLERFKIYAPPVSHPSEGPEGDSSSATELEHGEHLDSQGLES